MDGLKGLDERLKSVEKEIVQINRLDRETYGLTQKLSRVMKLLVDIVEGEKNVNKYDLDYIFIKLGVDPMKYHEVPLLLFETEKSYRKTGEFPNLLEFHQSVMSTLELSEEEQQYVPLEVTVNFLEKFLDDEYLPVCKEILLTR